MTTTTTAPAVRYLSVTDTAKAIRAALKAALPAAQFRVAKSAGGGRIVIRWTDGPTVTAVKAVAGDYDCDHFDAACDMGYRSMVLVRDGRIVATRSTGSYGSVPAWNTASADDSARGEWVQYSGAIEYNRTISAVLASRCIAKIAAYWGNVPAVPEVADSAWGFELLGDATGAVRPDLDPVYHSWRHSIERAAGDATMYVREA
jgi:hypothetical protein